MVQMYKISRNIDELGTSKMFTVNTNNTRGHHFKLFKTEFNLNTSKNIFSNRIINLWNSLPNQVVETKALNTFKTRLNDHWKNKANKFQPSFY